MITISRRELIKNLIDDVYILLALNFIEFRWKISYAKWYLRGKYIYKKDAKYMYKLKKSINLIEQRIEQEKCDLMLEWRIRYAWKHIFKLGR